MSLVTTDFKTELTDFSAESFDRFCEDLSAMFGVDMESTQTGELTEMKLVDLKRKFKKISAFNTVQSQGKIDGDFYLVFDQAGTFTLSGTFVMMPEARIREEIKKGLIQDIESMTDAIKETGNLAVGSWDRIFRENFDGHGHFVQGDVFIGKPWEDTEKSIGLQKDQQVMFIPYEITLEPFPPFNCGVIFPMSIFEEKTPDEEQPQTTDQPTDNIETDQPAAETNAEDKTQQEESADTINQPGNDDQSPAKDTAPEVEAKPEDKNTDVQPQADEEPKPEHVDEQQVQQSMPQNDTPVQKPQPDAETQPQADSVSQSIQQMTQSQASLPGENRFFAIDIKAQDIMDKNIFWATQEDSVQQAMTKMQDNNTRYLLIGNPQQGLDAIVSKSDLDAALSPYLRPIFSKWKRPLDEATLKIKLKWIMNKDVCFVTPQTPAPAIIQKMKKSARLCMPVMDQNKVVGMITASVIFSIILDNCPDEYKNFCDEI